MTEITNEMKVLDHGFVRHVDHMGSDLRIVEAARISYQSPSKGEAADRKLLRYLMAHKHTSPFEQVRITYNIRLPIFVMRQLVRHRMQSVNEVSARYTELPDLFYIPEVWRKQDTGNKQGSLPADDFGPDGDGGTVRHYDISKSVSNFCKFAYSEYQQLLSMGVAKEMARLVLPVNIYTEIYTTWDLNNLLKYFALRDDPHAQFEHQLYAQAMKNIARLHFPWTLELYDELLKPKET